MNAITARITRIATTSCLAPTSLQSRPWQHGAITDESSPSVSEALAVAGSIALKVRDAIEERDAAIRRAHAAGASVTDIAVTTGLTDSQVTSILG
jgi:hypothetical protein